MQKRTISNLVLWAVLLATLLIVYIEFRVSATRQARAAATTFFSELRQSPGPELEEKLTPISRHRDALKNFNYEKLNPEIDWTLHEAEISVSWHLSIIFSNRSGHWQPTFFVEYTPIPETTNPTP